ncbi:HRDC domain-containing protein [Desulforhopalus vacuolatus]|uniref:HRDC domain-containing protein n=1 Tax=Desulforhopalus vacuolatus TaxID=40414 RepID=UPI0019644833|nr:HRDC domain-containing protein [Desulforhopalus vacuolatus]MBM9519399.1 HRDC domain-containing protein [Desulforhopalus vacuolatus]
MDNCEVKLARRFLEETDCNIFLTGKAGTGKTTFLHTLKESCPKRMVVAAPTGVAAINAGGVTLHSFFQRPFGPWIPGQAQERHNLRKEKVAMLRNLDLLVIDEISMVRVDLLDSIDFVLRRYRNSELPFGGVQLLMIGDLYQLPPVVKENDWALLGQHYATPWFFSSQALQRGPLVTVELTKVYRQSDSTFVDLLNQIRDNRVGPAVLEHLNSRYVEDTSKVEREGTITLCTHNNQADVINRQRLEELPGRARSFSASVDGDFPESTWPTMERLSLKVGAQVMFVHNDPGPDKRFYNGRIGTVTRLEADSVCVLCEGDEEPIEVEAISWENMEYSLNGEMELEQEKIGSFTQIPLKQAWAITIHKSQGLTFDRLIVDAEAAFAHGQTYVALSRCRSFKGLTLRSHISGRAIQTDRQVSLFSEMTRSNPPGEEQLAAARLAYQQKLLLQCFNFTRLGYCFGRFLGTLRGNVSVVQVGGAGDLEELQRQAQEKIFTVAENFHNQLCGKFNPQIAPVEDPVVIERFTRASVWFQKQMTELIQPLLDNIIFETDNKQIRTRLRRLYKELAEEAAVKRAAVSCCAEEFNVGSYLRAIGAATIEKQSAPKGGGKSGSEVPLYREEDIANPEFFERLRRWRTEKAAEEDVPAYRVLAQKPLIQLAVHLPVSNKGLLKIHGIGPKLAERYGEELLQMIKEYRLAEGITEIALPQLSPEQFAERREPQREKPAEEKDGRPTREITLGYFRRGENAEAVAAIRGLKQSTVESHLAELIGLGEINIDEVLPVADIAPMLEALEPLKDLPWAVIKQNMTRTMERDISYGEVKCLMAHLTRRQE